MNMKRIMTVAYLVAAMVSICINAAADKTNVQGYLIPTDRPEKVGGKHRLDSHATIEVDSFAMADGKTYHSTSETGSVDLSGTLTIVAVASNGRPSAVDIVVEKCEMITNDAPSAIVKEGDRLAIMKETGASNATVRLNDIELDPKTAFIITSFMSLSDPDHKELIGPFYGLDVRRKVGDRWAINPANFTKYMKQYNPDAKEGDYRGTVEFKGITRTNGAEWAELKLDLTSIAPPPVKGAWKTTGFRDNTVISLSMSLDDKPARHSAKINRTYKMWMESDYTRHGRLQHLIFNTCTKYNAAFTITPLDSIGTDRKAGGGK